MRLYMNRLLSCAQGAVVTRAASISVFYTSGVRALICSVAAPMAEGASGEVRQVTPAATLDPQDRLARPLKILVGVALTVLLIGAWHLPTVAAGGPPARPCTRLAEPFHVNVCS